MGFAWGNRSKEICQSWCSVGKELLKVQGFTVLKKGCRGCRFEHFWKKVASSTEEKCLERRLMRMQKEAGFDKRCQIEQCWMRVVGMKSVGRRF